MSYIFQKMFGKLRRNFLPYLLLAVEFALGTAILLYCMNMSASAAECAEIIKREYLPTVDNLIFTEQNSENPPVTSRDIEMISEISEGNALCCIYRVIPVFSAEDKTAYGISAVFADENFFRKYGLDRGNYDGIAGKNVLRLMEQSGVNVAVNGIEFSRNGIKVGADSFSLVPLSENFSGNYLKYGVEPGQDTVWFDDCIIFRAEYLDRFDGNAYYGGFTEISLNSESYPNARTAEGEICDYLYSVHGEDYSYRFTNRYLDNLEALEYQLSETRRLTALSVIMLLILLAGFSGIVSLFMKKRTKELAVSMALGAKKSALIAELILEILMVCLVGTIVGSIFGTVFTVNAVDANFSFSAEIHPIFYLAAFGTAIAATFLTSLSPVRKILRMKPAELLKDL